MNNKDSIITVSRSGRTILLAGILIEVDADSSHGSLNKVMDAGNQQRINKGLKPLQMASFLESKEVKDRIEALRELDDLDKNYYHKMGSGRNTITYASIEILLLAAQRLSAEFRVRWDRHCLEGLS